MTVREITVRDLSLNDLGKRVEVHTGEGFTVGVLWDISPVTSMVMNGSYTVNTRATSLVLKAVTLNVGGWQSPNMPLTTKIYVFDS